ncbi:MAG: hypothetical protein GY723_06955 [bacterium]|nr:hypothetical protein [bacterium]MCP5069813.1 hypothetical protein [bacterium]
MPADGSDQVAEQVPASAPSEGGIRPVSVWAGAGVVFFGTLLLALPQVLAHWTLLPDAVEHLGIAHSWVSGAGFVDPLIYSYYLADSQVPLPGFVVRAPVISWLLALPLSLGATIPTVSQLHVVFASAIGASTFWLANRRLPLPAALAASLGFAWCYRWVSATQNLLTEAVGVGVLLLLLAYSGRAVASVRGALVTSGLLLLAWLTRPNLVLVLVALVLAVLLEKGVRGAFRSRPLWVLVGSFAILQNSVSWVYGVVTGIRPYAHYGVLLETYYARDAAFYQKIYVGWSSYLIENLDSIVASLLANAKEVGRALFVASDYHFVGWLAVPGLIYALRRRGEGDLERRVVAFSALGFAAVLLFSWGTNDPYRLALFVGLCGWLLAGDLLAGCGAWLAARRGVSPPLARALHLAPVALVVALFAFSQSSELQLRLSARNWRDFREHGTQPPHEAADRNARRLCAKMDRNARVASQDPWSLYLWCGNAGVWIPRDLDSAALVGRYLDEQDLGYLVVDDREANSFILSSPRLEELARATNLRLLRVRDATPESRPWNAPPALANLATAR